MPRTALIVAIPEAEAAVGVLRLAHDSSAVLGVPAHVTILSPFADGAQVDEPAIARARRVIRRVRLRARPRRAVRERLVWLHPEPSAPFAALTAAVWRRWPAYPPYEGAHEVVIPHLTVSEEPIEVDIPLPIKASARRGDADRRSGGRPLGRPPRVPALPLREHEVHRRRVVERVQERLRVLRRAGRVRERERRPVVEARARRGRLLERPAVGIRPAELAQVRFGTVSVIVPVELVDRALQRLAARVDDALVALRVRRR